MNAYRRRGLTVIELLVIIAIIAILAGMFLPLVQKYRNRGKVTPEQLKTTMIYGLVNRTNPIDLGSGWYYFLPSRTINIGLVTEFFINRPGLSNRLELVALGLVNKDLGWAEKLDGDVAGVIDDLGLTNGYLAFFRVALTNVAPSAEKPY